MQECCVRPLFLQAYDSIGALPLLDASNVAITMQAVNRADKMIGGTPKYISDRTIPAICCTTSAQPIGAISRGWRRARPPRNQQMKPSKSMLMVADRPKPR